MVHYDWARDLRAATSAFAARHGDRDWLCRHSEGGLASLTPRERALGLEGAFAELMQRFVRRFGARPTPPAAPGDR